ncbi:MAG: thiamine-phosphate kinase [Pseudomonadota bacterium]
MGEFDLIARHLAPLAGPGARGLIDDAAERAGDVITKDVLVEGVHFLPSDPIDLIARKALRVNMSDVIAKGAQPTAYLLGLVWPANRDASAFEQFAAGLKAEQELIGITLLGGDTTAGPALMISITMLGRPGDRGMIGRDGAKPGDAVMVTGTIGDGVLGLKAAKANPGADDQGAMPYRLPTVPLGLHSVIARYAKGSLDVSDGLIADAGHLAKASGVGVRIDADAVPLSAAGQKAKESGHFVPLLTGGDDYQALFTIDPSDIDHVQAEAPAGLKVTQIGRVTDDRTPGTVRLVGSDGKEILIKQGGWDHFR